MTGYLLDTNVVSELSKQSPHPAVVNFLRSPNDMWLSARDFRGLALDIVNPWEAPLE